MISGLLTLAILGGIGFALWSGLGRAFDPAERAALDAAQVVRSAAVAFGMYLAMLAISVGLIDVLQAIAAGERLAGSNSDLARALSLLIVGTPIFGLLARLVDKQVSERSKAGDRRAGIGWSAHLIAALTTTLVGVLVSCAQVIDDVGNGQGVEGSEVAQLAGWLLVWAAYWFGLRPRLGVRGHLHLLLGAAAGLIWGVAGLIGLGNDLGSQAYASLFTDALTSDGDRVQWLLVAAVGLVTWLWHWRVLDQDSDAGVETRPRRSRSWFAMVVGVGTLPALVALLSAVGAAMSGILIWFLGSPGESAVEWFDDAPGVFVVGCVALAVWAFHRWLLQRDGDPGRNEALRFHDYAVAGVGLTAVVAGVAFVVALVLDAATVGSLIARSFGLDNQLIGILVLLALGSGLWWRTWERIERNRIVDPVAESDSIWRKLYLIVAAGFGGLTLASSSIWILFTLLRDLFDGELGGATVHSLSGPVGWALAVLAAVWFHVGVWRADRAVLESVAPPPPPPPTSSDAVAAPPQSPQPPAPQVTQSPEAQALRSAGVPGPTLRWATPADYGELFTLQRAAFVDEAVAYNTPDVPSLNESFEEFQTRTSGVRTLVQLDGTRIVGAVGARDHDGLVWLERLMVVPDRRNEQLGHGLVEAVVGVVAADGHGKLRAVVGDRNAKLLGFYDSLEFGVVGRTEATDRVPELLVLEREINEPV